MHLISGLQLYILKILKLSQEYDKLSEGPESVQGQQFCYRNIRRLRSTSRFGMKIFYFIIG